LTSPRRLSPQAVIEHAKKRINTQSEIANMNEAKINIKFKF
jgi:hypothetical protein